MNLETNFYSKDFPEVGDIITIVMSEPKNDIVNSTIEEYPKLRGVMQTRDLTPKKRVRSIRQYLHKKPVPAEVTDIDKTTGIVSVTRRYLRGIEDKYLKYYQSKIKLINLIKNINRSHPDESLTTLVTDIIHPLMDYIYLQIDIKPPDIFKILEDMNLDDLPDLGTYHLEVIKLFQNMFREKPKKFVTKFGLICSVSVNNIIELFTYLKKEYPSIKFKLDTSPNYYFETFGLEDKELKLHSKVIDKIKTKSKSLNISFKSLD